MVCGNSKIVGIPWETVSNVCRKKLGDNSFGTLREYAKNFLDGSTLFSQPT
jgi:hypothetical protein